MRYITIPNGVEAGVRSRVRKHAETVAFSPNTGMSIIINPALDVGGLNVNPCALITAGTNNVDSTVGNLVFFDKSSGTCMRIVAVRISLMLLNPLSEVRNFVIACLRGPDALSPTGQYNVWDQPHACLMPIGRQHTFTLIKNELSSLTFKRVTDPGYETYPLTPGYAFTAPVSAANPFRGPMVIQVTRKNGAPAGTNIVSFRIKLEMYTESVHPANLGAVSYHPLLLADLQTLLTEFRSSWSQDYRGHSGRSWLFIIQQLIRKWGAATIARYLYANNSTPYSTIGSSAADSWELDME